MTSLVLINGKELQAKELRDHRVVTFKDIDTVHERVDGTAKRNFNANKSRFVENMDYFFVKPSDVEGYEIRTSEINNAGTYLITESGYLMLVKSLTDDLAWKVQRELVNNYFRAKQVPDIFSQLSPQTQVLINLELGLNKLESVVTETRQEIQDIRDVIALDTTSWRKDTATLINKMASTIGGFEHIKPIRQESYELLDKRMGVALQTRLTNKRRRMAGVCQISCRINLSLHTCFPRFAIEAA